MRNLRIAIVLSLALFAAGCGSTSIFKGGSSLTATVENPAGKRELAVIYNTYLIAGKAYVRYRDLGICRTGQEATFFKPCAKRSVLLSLQAADRKAYAAMRAAGRFIRDNPTLSAISVISAARVAVSDFQNAAQGAN